MNKTVFLSATFCMLVVLASPMTQAQEPDKPSKVEVGINFSSLSLSAPEPQGEGAVSFDRSKTEAGIAARFTFNLNSHVALEGETTFFPHEDFSGLRSGGRILQGQFGIKAGKRFHKFGLFAKARPGFVSFSKVLTVVDTETIDINGEPFTFPIFGERRKTHFSVDVGGVMEFYPSRRILTRIDVGDTIIHYGEASGAPFVSPTPFLDSQTRHNLQVTAGIGFRLLTGEPEAAAATGSGIQAKRFEVGAQFSSLGLQHVEHSLFGPVPFITPEFRDVITQAGFGGRLAYNITDNFALEAQTDLYLRDNLLVNNGRSGGRILQLQAGPKVGKAFEKFGIFAKARPGVVSFSKTAKFEFDPVLLFPTFSTTRQTYFALDLGGVLEFYPSPRIITRFDAGDTMIRYRSSEVPLAFFPALVSFPIPAETIHNFQFSAGVGYRF